jgi:hypothetical protein
MLSSPPKNELLLKLMPDRKSPLSTPRKEGNKRGEIVITITITIEIKITSFKLNVITFFVASSVIQSVEEKYLNGEITIDQMMDQLIYLFRAWKLSKFESMLKNKEAVNNLDRIENEEPEELPAEFQQDQTEVSDMEDSDTEISSDQREDRLGCFLCANDAVHESNFAALVPCGHIFCDQCCSKFKAANKCGGCRTKVDSVFPVYANFTFISRVIRLQAESNYARPKSSDERRQENVMAIRRMGVLPSSDPITSDVATDNATSGGEGDNSKLTYFTTKSCECV